MPPESRDSEGWEFDSIFKMPVEAAVIRNQTPSAPSGTKSLSEPDDFQITALVRKRASCFGSWALEVKPRSTCQTIKGAPLTDSESYTGGDTRSNH
jgi:hypothetical protein